VIRAGAIADLVLFDPMQVRDQSNFQDPAKLSTGVDTVLVNGKFVWRKGQSTGEKSGAVLTRDKLLPGR
jgi:N-acyl-D-amino-acid deacylase